jgi:hypothetical protein
MKTIRHVQPLIHMALTVALLMALVGPGGRSQRTAYAATPSGNIILYTGNVWTLRNDWKCQARSVSNSIRCSWWAVVRHVSNAARNS